MKWAIIVCLFLVGCATPRTHEEWAARCVDQSSEEEFRECLLAWDAWATKQLER